MSDRPANVLRGEAEIVIDGTRLILRPSFAALVARDRPEHLTRDQLGEGMMKLGLAGITPALKILLKQILSGRSADS